MVNENTQLVIVALVGKVGAGKSTACRLAEREFGAAITSVVDPLKKMTGEIYQLRHNQLWGDFHTKELVDPRYGETPRELMCKVGDAARRVMGDGVWIPPTVTTIGKIFGRAPCYKGDDKRVLVVVDSVRLLAEVKGLKDLELGDKVLAVRPAVRIVRLVPVNRAPSANDASHDSEDAVDRLADVWFDATFHNDHNSGPGTLENDLKLWFRSELRGWRR